ncbi:MAG: 2-keto-4-pentenoate hydratase [Mycobacterium sp.]|jgi:2-keto-4-pentenoate hydratase|nr:2-keto-4-pentenoate hydratase [Mycobacterium sp.]MDT7764182.1 2-keto-4-pentenoate hydratase [Mycobacterium sp.]
MTLTTTTLREAASRLNAAADTPCQCDPVRDILGERDIAAAYAVQRLLTEDALVQGRRIVGHKIGRGRRCVVRATPHTGLHPGVAISFDRAWKNGDDGQ